MTLSLVVPTYNEQEYIGNLLHSISLQTRLPDQIVICDNNSADNTLNEVKKYLPTLPITIVSEPVKGILPAVTTAFQHATGDIIFKTDADCYLPPTIIEKYYQKFNTDLNLAAAGGLFLPLDGNIIIKLFFYLSLPLMELIFLISSGHRILFGGHFVVRRQIFDQVGGYLPDGSNLPDDQLITQKLIAHRLKIHRAYDCWIYTSTRRYSSIKNTILSVLSIVFPKFYREKA